MLQHKASPIDMWHSIKLVWSQIAKTMYDGSKLSRYRVFTRLISQAESTSLLHNEYTDALQHQYRALQEVQHQQCLIRSQAQWDTKGELPTPYFTRIIKRRQAQRAIPAARALDGTSHTDPKGISEVFTSFFRNLYEKDPSNPDLLKPFEYQSVHSWTTVTSPISVEEVQETIARGNALKSPGPDGLGYSLYKRFSNEISPVLTGVFNSFLAGCPLPDHWKKGITTLIYKDKGSKDDPNNYRPITLLNVDYKIFTSILAKRIQPILKTAIELNQNGFIGSRLIFDNVITVLEYLDSMDTDPEYAEAIIALLDFNKAFDSISHNTIYAGLNSLGATPQVISLVTQLLTGSTIQVQTNNVLGDMVEIRRGTKQGDPISPILFIVGLELLNKALTSSTMEGFKLAKIRTVSSLFADDTALLCKNRKDLLIALELINNFKAASGLSLNITKSVCIAKEGIDCSPLPKSQGSERYLGFMIGLNGLADHTDKLLHSINAVPVPTDLTIYGKATLLRTYILPKIWYYMYLLPLDSKLMKGVQEVINKVLWNSRRVNRMQSTRASQPLDRGGLNVIDVSTRVKAQHAWIYNRSFKNQIWSKLWQKELSSFSRMFKIDFKHFQLKPGHDIQLKDIALKKIGTPALTNGQRKLETDHEIILNEIFTKIHKLKIRNNIKQVYWKYYNKCLPINKQQPQICPHDNKPDQHSHFILNCDIVPTLLQHANQHWRELTGLNTEFTALDILLLNYNGEVDKTYGAITLWTLWKAHNDWTHNNLLIPTFQQTQSIITSEIRRYVHAQLAIINAKIPKTDKEKAKKEQLLNKIVTTWGFIAPF